MHFPTFIEKLSRFVFALFLAVAILRIQPLPMVRAQEQKLAGLEQFDLLTTASGWILLGQHLFWTSNMGQTWEEIGPSVPAEGSIQDVRFMDPDTGWMLWTLTNADGSTDPRLAKTVDHGKTWTTRSLSLFEPGEIAAYAEKAEMGWLDIQTGWIAIKQISGSNFSLGTLFTTSDGGENWSRFTLPVADKIHFSDPQTGWAAGGPANDQIFRTQDGGATWLDVRPGDLPENAQAVVYPPFVSGKQGLLIVNTQDEENSLRVYVLDDSGMWLALDQFNLDVQPGVIGISILDAQNFVAAIPGTKSIVQMENDRLNTIENRDGLSASIVAMDMISLDVGWAKSVESKCDSASKPDPATAPVSCSFTTRLLMTSNGGVSWQSLDIPMVGSPSSDSIASGIPNGLTGDSLSLPANTEAFVGQGFDKCEIPTLSQMQTWSTASPYDVVNLYVGGSSRGCTNQALTPLYLFQLHQQGWKFIPTWVGPQAPCTGFSSRISSDAATAYTQGVNEADLAVEKLASLGLTAPDKSGSVIYYDIENYGTNTACRSAVNAFMNGWVAQLRTRGHLAGVYGSTLCNTGLSDFLSITNVPDLIWAARWYHNLGAGYYDPTASVWNLGSCVPNTVWTNHQRVRQYEGDHNESWGNLTLNIDSDVLDGAVAIPFGYPFVTGITRKDTNFTNASVVSFTVNFSEPVTGVDKDDFKLTITGITGASIGTVSGSGAAYTVTVNTGSGNGTIRLDVVDNNTIVDAEGNPLGGMGTGNGDFTAGQTYTITKTGNVNVILGGSLAGNYDIAATDVKVKSYANTLNGPVQTVNFKGERIIASQQVFYGDSFNELMGYPSDQFTTEYWFPWYDQVYMQTWILVGNPSTSQTAYVDIYINGVRRADTTGQIKTYAIPPGDRVTPQFPGIVDGPVRVVSVTGQNTPTPLAIFASERSLYGDSFNEVMGYPSDQFTTEYWFPWYDQIYMKTWILVGNPSTTQTAYVDIYINGTRRADLFGNVQTYAIPPGGSLTPQFPGMLDGAVRVVSVPGQNTSVPLPVFTSERSLYGTSFNEVMGYPADQFTTEYDYTWYDNQTMQSWILVGNPSTSQDAYVDIYIDGVRRADTTGKVQTYRIPPGGNVTPQFNYNTGPVKVVSVTGQGTNSPIPIFTSERSLYLTSFNEMMGYPANQLSSEYWFTWYDSIYMTTKVLLGRP